MPPRACQIAREARTDGRVARRVERQHLAVRRERGLQVGEPEPGLDDRGQVARLVLEHARRRMSPERLGGLQRSRSVRSGDSALTFYVRLQTSDNFVLHTSTF